MKRTINGLSMYYSFDYKGYVISKFSEDDCNEIDGEYEILIREANAHSI